MSDSIRLFIAISIAPEVCEEIAKLPRNQFPPMRWVNLNQLHMTLKFLGNVPKSQLQHVNDAAAQAVISQSETIGEGIRLIAQGIGAFPDHRRAQVVWAGLTGDVDALHRLQNSIEAELVTRGFPKDTRSFKPHITLARSRNPQSIHHLLDQYTHHSFGNWTINHLHVIRSELSPTGPRYTTLHSIPFGPK